jgi:hypothetical protein
VGLELVPVSHAGIIIALVVGVTMFNGYPDRFGKSDRVFNMKAIQAPLAKMLLNIAAQGDAVVRYGGQPSGKDFRGARRRESGPGLRGAHLRKVHNLTQVATQIFENHQCFSKV